MSRSTGRARSAAARNTGSGFWTDRADTWQIAPGIHLISLVSDKPGTLELRGLSLAPETPEGIVLVVGWSHPGIENIVRTAAGFGGHIHMIAGGLHLVTATDADIDKIVANLHDDWKVDLIAPGHLEWQVLLVDLTGKRQIT